MDLASIAVVYLLLWWLVFLMSLPFGVRTPESPPTGHATSAPERPLIWRKIAASTVISAVLTLIVHWVITNGVITIGALSV